MNYYQKVINMKKDSMINYCVKENENNEGYYIGKIVSYKNNDYCVIKNGEDDEDENTDSEKLKGIIEDYGAKIIDVSNGCFVAELTGDPTLIDDFLDAVKPFKMLEMCRTGATALERGKVSYDIQ